MQRILVFVVGLMAGFWIGQCLSADSTQSTFQKMNRMPLAFTKNMGQWDERVLFRADAGSATMWFTKEGVTYQFTRHVVTMV